MERPIAPATPRHSRSLYTFPASLRRKNVATACFACRKRKTKCGRGRPCGPCEKYSTECISDRDSDCRREIAMRRKLHELERDEQLLNLLVETLRGGENDQVSRVLGAIRSTPSKDQATAWLCNEWGVRVPAGSVPGSEHPTPEDGGVSPLSTTRTSCSGQWTV